METNAGLSEEQEARRRAGLRMLARIIARRYLEQPPCCAADDGAVQAGDRERSSAPESNGEHLPDREQG